MRTWTWIIGVVLVVLIAAAAWFVFTGLLGSQQTPNNLYPSSNTNPFSGSVTSGGTTTPISNTSTDPTVFSKNFYTWYIKNVSTNPAALLSDQFAQALAADWLTPAFAASWQSEGDAMDADPFLFSQAFDASWLPGMSVSTLGQDSASSTVHVSFAAPSSNAPTPTPLDVTLARATNGQWRIASVTPAQ